KASQLYTELHPEQPAPSHKVVGRLIRRFLATGSVQEMKHGRPKSATAENNTIDILDIVELKIEPKLILKTNKIHPYKTRFVQELLIFSDKSTFVRHGQVVSMGPTICQKQIFTTLHMSFPNTLKN
uniref:DUF4817 domain-containing protein n=1 Tax=Strigamia maritima TaxID=126957 RepID=T1JAI1_STRMM